MEKQKSGWWLWAVAATSLSMAANSVSGRDASHVEMSRVALEYVGMHLSEASHHGLWASVRVDSWRMAKVDVRGQSETAQDGARINGAQLISKRHPDLVHDAGRAVCVMSSQSVWVCQISNRAAPDTQVTSVPKNYDEVLERPLNWHAVGVGKAVPARTSELPTIVGPAREPIQPTVWPSHMTF